MPSNPLDDFVALCQKEAKQALLLKFPESNWPEDSISSGRKKNHKVRENKIIYEWHGRSSNPDLPRMYAYLETVTMCGRRYHSYLPAKSTYEECKSCNNSGVRTVNIVN